MYFLLHQVTVLLGCETVTLETTTINNNNKYETKHKTIKGLFNTLLSMENSKTSATWTNSTDIYRNFVCIRHFFTQIFTFKSGVRLIHKARNRVFYIESPPRPHGDQKSMTLNSTLPWSIQTGGLFWLIIIIMRQKQCNFSTTLR